MLRIHLLEEQILSPKERFPAHSLIISGDLNARIKDAADYLYDDQNKYVPLPEHYPVDIFDIPRNSRDTHGEINKHGKALLNLCRSQNIHILNGRVSGDIEGHLTCFTNMGSSTVDYTIASSTLFPSITHF